MIKVYKKLRISKKVRLLILIFALLLTGIFAAAKEHLPPLIPYKTDTPPVIDGILNDHVWQKASHETGFKTYYPDYGIEMVENTVVYYAYDMENLYFAYRCFDSQPDKIKASVTNRDNIASDDWICVNLDSFNDQQSLYVFYCNPMGIQGDSRFEGGQDILHGQVSPGSGQDCYGCFIRIQWGYSPASALTFEIVSISALLVTKGEMAASLKMVLLSSFEREIDRFPSDMILSYMYCCR